MEDNLFSRSVKTAVSSIVTKQRTWSHSRAEKRRKAQGKKPILPYLEVHVTDHCNLNCKGCGHFSCISPEKYLTPESFASETQELARLFENITLFRIMGGEPLLHPHVLDFLVIAQKAFPRSELVLVTNGILLPKMNDSFWETLARLGVVIFISGYPIKLDRKSIQSSSELFKVPVDFGPQIESFETFPIDPSHSHDPKKELSTCRQTMFCPFLYEGKLFHCAGIALAWILEERFGVSLPVTKDDCLELATCENGWDAMKFLEGPVPWCGYCAWEESHSYEWGPTKKDASEWLIETE